MKAIELLKDWNRLQDNWGIRFAYKVIIKPRIKRNITYKHEAIISYLEHKYSFLLEKYKTINQPIENLSPNCPIWICWYQGETNMPPIVKACVNSIKKYANKHPIYIITSDNIATYIQLPNHILKKVENKQISLTHFSDIIRNNLLAQCGGIWLDATIYLTDKLREWNKPFYSLKQNNPNDHTYVTEYKWTGFCMGGSKGNIVNTFVSDFFNEYHKRESDLLDYFLIDYIIAVGYRNIPSIKKLIDDIPPSNPSLYYLLQNLNQVYNPTEFERIKQNTHIFKITWKLKNKEYLVNSYYQKIINNII